MMIDLMRLLLALAEAINGRRVSAGHFNLWDAAAIMIVVMVKMAGDIIPYRLRPSTRKRQPLEVQTVQRVIGELDVPDAVRTRRVLVRTGEDTTLQEPAE